ncbi:hypothetical protein Tco_1454632, partial [Tanacetum coccineum]
MEMKKMEVGELWEMDAIGGSLNPMINSLGDRYAATANLNAKEDLDYEGVKEGGSGVAALEGLISGIHQLHKMETAINIGFACSLLQHGMRHICIMPNVDISTNDTKE